MNHLDAYEVIASSTLGVQAGYGEDIDLPAALIDLVEAIEADIAAGVDIEWGWSDHVGEAIGDYVEAGWHAMACYHGGQSSPEYAALCALGRIYRPAASGGNGNELLTAVMVRYMQTQNRIKRKYSLT